MPRTKKPAAKKPAAPVGHPPLYRTPEALQVAIDKFYVDCDANKKPYTVIGLALDLGFISRQSLFDQMARSSQFSDAITRAKNKIERQKAERLLDPETKNVNGLRFDLQNNHGWRERTDVNLGGQPGNPVETKSNLEALPLAALKEIRAIRDKYQCKNSIS
jgi:hypothetical protein